MHLTTKKTNRVGALVARALTAAFVASLVGLALDGRQEARAYPPFAKKENKQCIFCHLKPSGGARNDAGKYYKAHGLSLKGYPGTGASAASKPKAAAKPKAKPPAKKASAKGTKP